MPSVVVPMIGALVALVVSAPAAALRPSLRLDPLMAGPGATVTAEGSGFCAAPGCSPVEISAGTLLLAEEVEVGADGTFEAFFVAPSPGEYEVVASQRTGEGRGLRAAELLLVGPVDVPSPPGLSPPAESTTPAPPASDTPGSPPSAATGATGETRDGGASPLPLVVGLGLAAAALAALAFRRSRRS